jgi:hypothetical protein
LGHGEEIAAYDAEGSLEIRAVGAIAIGPLHFGSLPLLVEPPKIGL